MWLVQANAAYAYGNSQSNLSSVTTTETRYTKNTGGLSATISGNEYAVTVSPSINSINWHDKVLGGERSFDTFTGATNASYRFPAAFSATFLGSWQYTTEKLLPGDQLFSIGGPTTVRGYTTNTAAGDSGYYFNAELHRDMSDIVKGLDLFAFLDSGQVFSTAPAKTQLDSSGFGVSWTPIPALTFEGSVGVPWRVVVSDQPHQQFYGRVTFRPLFLL
jgi:hemolysin activation/secretion protein